MTYFREQDSEYVWDHFERSVPMSTYLVAMIVCDFEHRTSDPINDVDVRIWARKNAIEQTEYARSIAAKILRYFEVRLEIATESVDLTVELTQKILVKLSHFCSKIVKLS